MMNILHLNLRIQTLLVYLALSYCLLFQAPYAKASEQSRPEIIHLFDSGDIAMKEYGDYNRALSYFLKFIKAAENEPERYSEKLMKAYSTVSIIYGSFRDYPKACEYNLKGLELSHANGNSRYEVSFLTNLATCMIELNRLDEADSYADSLKKVTTAVPAVFNHLVLKGDIYRKRGEWELARSNWEKARAIGDSAQLPPARRAYPYECLAAYYGHRNSTDSQLSCLKESARLSEMDNDPFRKIQTIRELMRFYTRNGNTRLATQFQDRYFELSDSLMNMENFLRIRSAHEKYLLDEKTKEVDALILTVSGQRRVIIAAIAILLLLITLLIIIWKQKRNLNQTYKILYKRTRESVSHPKNEDTDDSLFELIEAVMADSDTFCKPDFSLATLTSLVNSNTTAVSRVINIKTGQNVRAYINSYRIKEACRRIDDKTNYGHLTLQAIGESVGYNTQVNFNRMFKATTGLTPSLYMKMSGQKD